MPAAWTTALLWLGVPIQHRAHHAVLLINFTDAAVRLVEAVGKAANLIFTLWVTFLVNPRQVIRLRNFDALILIVAAFVSITTAVRVKGSGKIKDMLLGNT